MLITHFSKPRFIVLLCLILWSPLLAPEAASQTRGWGETLSIYFRAGSADYDPTYLDNGKRLEEYLSKIQSVMSHNEASSVKISCISSFSPEGKVDFNKRLAKKRSETGASLLAAIAASTTVSEIMAPWDDLLKILESDKGAGVPFRDETVEIVRSIIEGNASYQDLRSFRGSKPWKYIVKNLFPSLRRCLISVSIDTPPVPYVSSAFRPAAPVASVSAPQVIIDRKVSPLITLPKDYFVGIKTNLLYDFASVTNVSVEVGYAKHYSFELLGTFSPWDYGRETLQFRTALLQPEFRYWFSEGWTRHFVGLHAHLGWYNIAPGGKVRYQDHNGNSPLVGVGLSYGYVVPFTSHWGAEFSVGAGYAYLSYDKFYNIHNGALFGTGEKHYFGLTKLGASVYYRF